MQKLSPERERLRERELAQGEIAARAAEVDRSEQYPWAHVEALRGSGFFGMTITRSYGGAGLGAAGYSRRCPLERMARDARMFTRIPGEKLPQGRDGYARGDAAE